MIVGIPTGEDFRKNGIAFFNLAWEMALGVADTVHWLEDRERDEVADDYDPARVEAAAQDKLRTAMLLTQQGIELLLKGKIASVSPFLLLRGKPSEWPKSKRGQDLSFADIRTIDAQDLIRLHNVVTPSGLHLSEHATQRFDELRRQRNAIAHTVDSRSVLQTTIVIKTLLDVFSDLYPGESWVDERRIYIESDHIAEATAQTYEYGSDARLIGECETLLRLLTRKECEHYFHVPAKERILMCYSCHIVMDHFGELGRPKFSVALNVGDKTLSNCFVCHEQRLTIPGRCLHAGCDGVMFDAENEVCLTCGSSHCYSPL